MAVLSRQDVRKALSFGYPPRPPQVMTIWADDDPNGAHWDALRKLGEAYPDDVVVVNMPIGYWYAPEDDPRYRFAFGDKTEPKGVAIDSCPIIADWSELGKFLDEFPVSDRPDAVEAVRAARQANPDSYILAEWDHFFHQRLAYIRGIEALLYDFYDARDKLCAVMDRLLDLYRVWTRRAAEAGADGVWGGDDLGTQCSLFMRPETFREVYAPYYRALSDALHSNGLDFWFHTCGNVTELMDDLIDCGVDALHPIQAGIMNDHAIAERYGGRIAFWIGMDVQYAIPRGTPEEVRKAVRERMHTFYRPDGGLILSAGNSFSPDTPVGNVRAYLETLCEPITLT